jgi:hypothetical protein
LLIGELAGHQSKATVFSPLVGAEISLPAGAKLEIPTRPDFEYGLLILEGDDGNVNGETVARGSLRYLSPGTSSISLTSVRGGRVLLIGGEPFPEEILMWWNFIARSHEEIIALREQWQASLPAGSEIYPEFIDSLGARIPAPEMPNIRLEPRGPKR